MKGVNQITYSNLYLRGARYVIVEVREQGLLYVFGSWLFGPFEGNERWTEVHGITTDRPKLKDDAGDTLMWVHAKQ